MWPGPSLKGGIAKLLQDRALLLLYGEAFVLMGILVTVHNYAAFRLMEPPYTLSQTEVGAVFLLYIVGSISSAWFGGLAGRLGRRRVFFAPVLMLIAGVVLTAARPLALIIIGVSVVTAASSARIPLSTRGVGRRALANRGQASALYLFPTISALA